MRMNSLLRHLSTAEQWRAVGPASVVRKQESFVGPKLRYDELTNHIQPLDPFFVYPHDSYLVSFDTQAVADKVRPRQQRPGEGCHGAARAITTFHGKIYIIGI